MHQTGASAPFSSDFIRRRDRVSLSVCVKKSLCVFCVEEEKIRLTLFSRKCSRQGCSAPWAPISFVSRDLICWVSVWKSRCVSFVSKKRKFDSLCSLVSASARCFCSFQLPFDCSQRFNSVSVCVKKSMCVFCVEEERIRLTLFSRKCRRHRSLAALSPIWLYGEMECRWVSAWKSRSVSFVLKKRKFDSLCCFEVQKTNVLLLYLRFDSTPRFNVGECLCEKVDLCLLCWRRENSTHCVVSKCRRQMFCSFISVFCSFYLRFDCRRDLKLEWVSVWKSRSVSFVLKKRKFDSLCCFEVQKTNVLLLYLRFDSIWDLIRVSVCVKKSICVFCVEEEKIRLTVLFRSAEDKCSAPFSPIWFETTQ